MTHGQANLTQPIDAAICPLCGQPNRCGMQATGAGEKSQPCWCASTVFTAELLRRVPSAAQGVACVCQACASASGGNTDSMMPPPRQTSP